MMKVLCGAVLSALLLAAGGFYADLYNSQFALAD